MNLPRMKYDVMRKSWKWNFGHDYEHCMLCDLRMCGIMKAQNTKKNLSKLEPLAEKAEFFYFKDKRDKVVRIICNSKKYQSVIFSHKENKLNGVQELLNSKNINCLRSYGK